MLMSDLVFMPAHQLAKVICERQVSSLEVLEAYLQQIATHNSKVNAFITLDEERARQRAMAADEALANGELWGPLHGVPVTVKDCFETAGLRTTCGYKGLADYFPAQDATVVARIRAAGAIVFGKTNLAILASDMQARSDFGQTNNPWNVSYTAGGSSGGSAAAVAAGFSPLDLCAGLGGSARIPAHFCGVFGIKPTEQRVSMAGAWAAPLEGSAGLQYMYAAGVMTSSIADLKLWLSLVEGEDPRSFQVPPAPPRIVDERPLRKYRIAWTDCFGTMSASMEIQALLEQLANTLDTQGCQIEKASPPDFNFTDAWKTYGALTGAWLATRPIPIRPLILDNLRKLLAGGPVIQGAMQGARLNLNQFAAMNARRNRFTMQLDAFLSGWDAWLCPVVGFPAFPHQVPAKPIEVDGQSVPYVLGGVAYTSLFTLTGHPVVVLPVGQTNNGLPIGVQLVGHRWKDHQLLDLAEKIVEVTGTVSQPPGYIAHFNVGNA